MDGREGMALQGPASYYLNRGSIGGSGGGPGPGHNVHGAARAPVFSSNSDIHVQPNRGISVAGVSNSGFHVDNPPPDFSQSMSMAIMASASQGGEIVKKKRGRPRKYGPDGANMSLELSASRPSSALVSPGEKARKGRPPGTGWKQKLAPLGEWMNNSAGLAFTPHVLHVGVGEDIAGKILAFAQQRPRALCILSANGSVSAVTLRQPTTSGGTVTYEGRFEILCLSGSYLLDETGGPRDRTGGISISICSPDGHIIGGAIGGRLTAANSVQVVAFSFVYGGTKAKNRAESGKKDEKCLIEHSTEKKSLTPVTAAAAPSQSFAPNSGTSSWPPVSQPEVKNARNGD